jgi:hypothetical protein
MNLRTMLDKILGDAFSNENDPEKLASERKKLLSYVIFANIMANFYGGNFYTGLLLLMNASDSFMGTLSMINIAVGILPIFSAVVLDRFERRKKILVIFRIIIDFLSIVVIGIIPLLNIENGSKLSAVLMITFITGCIANIASPGYSVWHIRLIPEDKRAGYFSFMSIVTGIIGYVITIAASNVLDHFKAMGYELQTILILRAVALVFACLEVVCLIKVKEFPVPRTYVKINVMHIFKRAMKSGKYLVSIAIGCMYAFAANLQGPYFSIYLLKDLGLKYSYLSLISFLYMPFMIFLMPVWSRIIRKISWNRALIYCLVINVPVYCLYPFTTKSTLFMYLAGSILSYTVAPGFGLVFSNNTYHNLPENDRTELIGFYATVYNLFALAGVSFGKWFIGATEGKFIKIFGLSMMNKQYIMFLMAFGLLAMAIVVYFINKRDNVKSAEAVNIETGTEDPS